MNQVLAESFQSLTTEYSKFKNFALNNNRLNEKRELVRSRMGQTSRTEIYREHSTRLFRYKRSSKATINLPMLVLPSLVNRPNIMDLLPGESFIEGMLERGFDVYMLEWGEPTPGQREFTLEYYLRKYVGRAIRRVKKASGSEGITLAGYCLGGFAALLYAALDQGKEVKNLVTMVTPVNFVDEVF